jgi:hypothetical protein
MTGFIDMTLSDDLQVEDVDPQWPTEEELAEAGFSTFDPTLVDNDGNPIEYE